MGDSLLKDMLLSRAAGGLRMFLCLMTFAVPFMLGCQMMPTENGNMPTDILVWIILGFTPPAPAFLVMIPVAAALIWTALLYPFPKLTRDATGWLLWSCLLLAGTTGLVQATEWDYARNWMIHFSAVAMMALTVWWASRFDRKLLPALVDSVAAGTILLCLHGWSEHFIGMARRLKQMQAEYQAQFGTELPQAMADKMAQTRLNGFFSDPNVFAAHLLLGIPVTLLALARRLKCSAAARGIGAVLFLALAMPVFCWTGSRGAAIGMIAGGAVGVWCLPWIQSKPWKWLLPVLAVVAVLGLYAVAARDEARGGVATASVRMGYYQCAWRMFTEAPLTGRGLGEFFPWYMRWKAPGWEVSRDPHCFFFGALSQCGILGALAVLAILGLPFAAALKRTAWHSSDVPQGGSRLDALVVGGLAAWSIHSFFQFIELIPATVLLLAWMPLLLLPDSMEKQPGNVTPWSWKRIVCLAAAMAGLAVVLCKIPDECRLDDAVAMENDLRRLQAEADRGTTRNPFLAAEIAAVQRRYEALLLELTEDMPLAPAPCKMLLESWRTDVLDRQGKGQPVPTELITKISLVAGRLVRRTPHRSASWNWLAWALCLEGKTKQAETALQTAEMWCPTDESIPKMKESLLETKQHE